MATEIKLPALKENVDTVEVNAVRCAPGETVAKDQVLLEVQADKTALDVPSPTAGRVTEVRVKIGEQIKVGQVICLIEGGGNGEAAKPAAAPAKKPETPAPAPQQAKQQSNQQPGPRPQPATAAPKPAAAPATATTVN